MSNNPNRLWILATAVISIAVIAIGWFLGVSPQLAAAKIADEQRVNTEALNVATEAEIAALKVQIEGIDDLRARLDELSLAIPSQANLSEFLTQASGLAALSGVAITDVAVADAKFYSPTSPEVAEGAEETDDADVAPAEDAPVDATAGGLVTPENFVSIEIALKFSGGLNEYLNFLNQLQTGERLFLVTDLTFDLADDGATYQVSVTGLIYVLLDPNTAAPTGEADPAAEPTPTETPAPTETPVAEATPTPTPTP